MWSQRSLAALKLAGLMAFVALVPGILVWPRPIQTAATSLTDAAAVAAGSSHTCALTTAGGVKCWGSNLLGAVGDGTKTNRTMPVDVVGLGSGVAAIAAGDAHTCVLTTAGGVKCWGLNYNGQLGDGTTTIRHTPVDVVGLTNGVSAISAGDLHTCAVTTAGEVKCWGFNGFGQLGNGMTTNVSIPVDVIGLGSAVASIAVGGNHTCALTTAGGVKCWGSNAYGQLGDGTTTSQSTPVDVVGLTSGIAAVAAGDKHTCTITTAGGAKCWGRNAYGQLGDGTTTSRSTPVDVSGLASGVAAINPGLAHTCALTTAGGAKCWGRNSDAQLGDGTNIDRITPAGVSGLAAGVAAIDAASRHSCAMTTTGGFKCWGFNGAGQLGDGTTTSRSTPVDVLVPKLTPTPTPTTGTPTPTSMATSTPTPSVTTTPAATPTPSGQLAEDTDGDGCTNTREDGSDATMGGLRDYLNFWDFFDPNLDGTVGFGDFLLLVQHFGTADAGGQAPINRNSDPLTTPDPGPGFYHPLFDRGPVVGKNPWNVGPPDGAIAFSDFLSLMSQFGHNCGS